MPCIEAAPGAYLVGTAGLGVGTGGSDASTSSVSCDSDVDCSAGNPLAEEPLYGGVRVEACSPLPPRDSCKSGCGIALRWKGACGGLPIVGGGLRPGGPLPALLMVDALTLSLGVIAPSVRLSRGPGRLLAWLSLRGEG